MPSVPSDTTAVVPTERGTLLIVDDEEGVRITLQAMFEMDGYRVEVAASAKEARDLLRTEAFDAVVCDLRINEDDGRDVLAEVQRRSPTTAQILLTGYATPDMLDALHIVTPHVLHKPVEIDELRLTVATGVARRRQLNRAN